MIPVVSTLKMSSCIDAMITFICYYTNIIMGIMIVNAQIDVMNIFCILRKFSLLSLVMS